MSDSPHQTLPPGYILRDYCIEKVLGQGGFGITYLATETLTNRSVVIKENFPEICASRDLRQGLTVVPISGQEETYSWSLKSFVKEANTLIKLPYHKNVVTVLAVFRENNTAYIVMQRIEGQSLEQLYPPGTTMPKEKLLPFMRDILDALGHIHKHKVIHRDIKPDNIILTPEGLPVLIDFGAARSTEQNRNVTQIGTPGYAAPEQLSSNDSCATLQASLDIYAMGSTCYRLITGQFPQYVPSTLAEQKSLKLCYPAHLLRSIDNARRLVPEERWQTADEWLAAIPESKPMRSKKSCCLHTLLTSFCGFILFIWVYAAYQLGPQYAIEQNYPWLLRSWLLLPGIDVNDPCNYHDSLLLCALNEQNTQCINTLIAAGADVNPETGFLPLCIAASLNRTDYIDILLAAGADINRGFPIADCSSIGCIRHMILKGANVHYTEDGFNALMVCSRIETIDELLTYDATLNINDEKILEKFINEHRLLSFNILKHKLVHAAGANPDSINSYEDAHSYLLKQIKERNKKDAEK